MLALVHNTRNSGRFNSPGQFVQAAELAPGAGAAPGGRPAAMTRAPLPPPPAAPYSNPPNPQYQQAPRQAVQHQAVQHANLQTIQTTDVVKSEQMDVVLDEQAGRPPWMKNKLAGIKKVSNRERRRRQNESLRKLITPKNALMVLNEMMPNEQLTNQFKVEPAGHHAPGGGGGGGYFNRPVTHHSFCADLTLDGQTYKGYGDNKLSARNAAAEQAIRDLIIKRMNKPPSAEGSQNGEEASGAAAGDAGGAAAPEEEALPMIQLASFALHKLFADWECEGHKVPQLKPQIHLTSEAGSEAAGAAAGAKPFPRPAPTKKPKELPLNAAAMHPSMLLSYMRPQLEYRELAVEGDRPQAMTFTLGVDVDGATYIGKASNKKEARRLAARSACQALFGVAFDDVPSANAPVPKE